MRFMMLVIPKGYEKAPPGTVPDAKAVEAMMRYNEALQAAGVLLTLDGLHPPSMGARVSFAGGKPTVTDGPFIETTEVLGGYWMIDVKSKAEAIAWASRCPMADNEIIEIRQVQEMSDFPPDVQKAAAGFDAMQAQRCGRWLDFTQRVPVTRNDEVGQSVRTFNSLFDTLQHSLGAIVGIIRSNENAKAEMWGTL